MPREYNSDLPLRKLGRYPFLKRLDLSNVKLIFSPTLCQNHPPSQSYFHSYLPALETSIHPSFNQIARPSRTYAACKITLCLQCLRWGWLVSACSRNHINAELFLYKLSNRNLAYAVAYCKLIPEQTMLVSWRQSSTIRQTCTYRPASCRILASSERH
jgi:hypothetical protein